MTYSYFVFGKFYTDRSKHITTHFFFFWYGWRVKPFTTTLTVRGRTIGCITRVKKGVLKLGIPLLPIVFSFVSSFSKKVGTTDPSKSWRVLDSRFREKVLQMIITQIQRDSYVHLEDLRRVHMVKDPYVPGSLSIVKRPGPRVQKSLDSPTTTKGNRTGLGSLLNRVVNVF